MLIANPIYDVVFKHLLEDLRIAKFFIETLTGEVIKDLQVKPQEFTYKDELAGLSVFRVDFIATVQTKEEGYKKVLIEIQKAKNVVDLMRFRNYLAEQYKKEDEIVNEKGQKEMTILPIITIYLLGFNLHEIETPAVKVNRQYIDMRTGKVIQKKDEFIEKLTHDSYVVQIPRIDIKWQGKLGELLSVFEQTNFADDKKITKNYTRKIEGAEQQTIVDILHKVGTEPEIRQEIEKEEEAFRVLDVATKEKTKELKIELEKSYKTIEDKDKLIEDKDKLIEDKDKLIEDKDKLIEDKDKLIEELKRKLEGR